MRLPVVHQISTKDGVSNKNARLTNVLKETRATGDLAVVRPGLETAATATGNGNGLVCFNGELIGVAGTNLSKLLEISSEFSQYTMPSSASWYGVAYGDSIFCAVAYSSNKAAISNNGILWDASTLPSSTTWSDITWNGQVFCAIANLSTSAATSPDGINWTPRTVSAYIAWRDIVSTADGDICAIGGFGFVTKSVNNGVTWNTYTTNSIGQYYGLAHNGSIYCSLVSGTTYCETSTNGETWVTRTLPYSSTWTSVAYGGGIFLAVGSGTKAAISSNGTSWYAATMPVSASWTDVSWDGSKFIVISTNSTTILTTVDGVSWGQIVSPVSNLSSVTSDVSSGFSCIVTSPSDAVLSNGILSLGTVSDSHYDFTQSPI